jgi:hypothetical protein
VALNGLVDRIGRFESDNAGPSLGDFHDPDVKAGRDVDEPARAELPTRMYQRFEVSRDIRWSEQKNLRGSAGIPVPQQPRAKHARGVQGQRVAARNEVDQVGEAPVLEGA